MLQGTTGYVKNDVFIYIATIFIYPPHQSPSVTASPPGRSLASLAGLEIMLC